MLVLYSAVAGFVYSNSVFFVVWNLECGRHCAAHDFDVNLSGYYISFWNEEMRKTLICINSQSIHICILIPG